MNNIFENVNKKLGVCKEKVNKLHLQWQKYVENSFGNTQMGMYIMTVLVISVTIGELISNFFLNRKIGFLVGAAIGIMITWLLLWIVTGVLKFLLRNGEKSLVYTVALGINMVFLAVEGTLNVGIKGNIIYAGIVFLALCVFAKSLWAFTINLKRTKTIYLSMGVSGIIVVIFVIMMVGKGFLDIYIPVFLENNRQVQEKQVVDGFDEYIKEGKYEIASFEYSPFEKSDIKSDTVNLTYYVQEEEWYNALYRSFYQNDTLEEAGIAGKVWYPKDKQNCPIVFVVHGNHNIKDKSYEGYDYLGKYLASFGYVVVSVDENILNQRNNENDARAVLLLENIKIVEKFNQDINNPLYEKADFDNIALVGHSRGGEAITAAYLFNSMKNYPSNGSFKFDYNFNIKSLIAIAPSVNQYMPAGHSIYMEDVNYLLIQGANDQDVSTFCGNIQYENISFSENSDYIKSSLYIAGANHGQFNSKWGLYDWSYPFARWHNVGNFIKSKEQKEILKIFSKVFLDKTLCGNNQYSDLLTDYDKYCRYLPETVYIQQYETSGFESISDFEEDSNLTTATDENVSISAKNMAIWTEEMLMFSKENSYLEKENHALFLKWKNTRESRLTFSFKNAINAKKSKIQFDICNLKEADMEKAIEIFDMTIVLQDSKGKEISGRLKDFISIYPPLPVKLSKVQYLSNEDELKKVFQTVSIPVSELEKKDKSFDYKQIKKMEFVFDKEDNGIVNIDNVGFVK